MRDQSYGHKESTRPSATRQTTIRKLATALRSRQQQGVRCAHLGDTKTCTWALDDDELAAACALRLGAVLDELPPCEAALNDLRSMPVSTFSLAAKKMRQTSAYQQIKKSDGS